MLLGNDITLDLLYLGLVLVLYPGLPPGLWYLYVVKNNNRVFCSDVLLPYDSIIDYYRYAIYASYADGITILHYLQAISQCTLVVVLCTLGS